MKPLLDLLRIPLLRVAGLSFAINLLMLTPSLFMLQVFDRVLVSLSGSTLLALLVGAGMGLVLMGLFDQLRARMQALAGQLVTESLSPAVTRLSVAQGARRQGKAPVEALRDIGTLRTLFSAQGLLALFDAPWLLIYLALIWLAHPVLGVTATLAALGMLALAVLNDRITRREIEELQRASAGATRYLETSLAHAEVVQALGMTTALIDRWRAQSGQLGGLQASSTRRTATLAAITRTYRQAVQIVMLAAGAWLVINSLGSPGITVACTILLGRALAPVEQIVGNWRLLAEGRLALQRLAQLLESAQAQPQSMPLPEPRGKLLATQLAYRAPSSDRILLAGASFQLDIGEALAIIGPSGAGKSTLLRLLSGVWPPLSGTVRLDGSDLSQWPREQLGPWLGYLPQDVELFPGTVAENIARLGQVDPQAVVQAAQRARAHELIQALPQGYDTPIDPQSALVSPGQRQRIALARALYGTPRLILLDEPNANLDGAGEAALAEAVKAMRGQVTLVVVTHRTSLLRQMDKLMVLEAGKVQHFGAVDEVMKAMQAQARPSPDHKVVAMPVAHGATDIAPLEARP
jgi:PrtD family type I secretion system ABC transporter